MRRIIIAGAALLLGCAPRSGITPLSASSDGVTLTYPTGTAASAVAERAETICASYGKRARPALTTAPTNDERWSVASFYCVPRS